MSDPNIHSLPVIVFACKIFQHWLENILPPALNAKITFFDYGLHTLPKKLHIEIQSAIDSIQQPSLILLGYGLCGNGLANINAGKHYLLVPRMDDCISILLGSYQAYVGEISRQPATYYLSKGWLESGSTPVQESKDLAQKYGVEKAAWFMNYQYHNYKRLVFVARSQAELERYRPQALEVAAYCEQWKMQYEEIIGSDDLINKFTVVAGDLDQLSDEFIFVKPGEILRQSHFIHL